MQNDASVNRPVEPRANILLVDDSPANLLTLGAVLDDLGHNLVEARSGQEALRLLPDRDFAVILLDVQMHGLDGFETARRIRARDRSRHTPIIFLTAHDDNRLSVERAYALGAVDYLTKPLVPVILRAKVQGFVELFRKTEQVQRQAERLRQMERQEFERKLSEENARFRALTEHSSDAVALIHADGTVLYNSPSSRRVLGYEPDELLGRSGFEVIHPDDQQCVREGLAELVRGAGAPVTVEVRARHKDGSWRWVECVGTNLLGEAAVGAVVVNFRDISERKAAADALRDSEERFRQLAENINAVFWMTDPQKVQVLYVSPAYEAIWGRSCHSLYERPRSFLDAIHPDDRARVVAESLDRQARGEASDVEYRVVRPDGAVRWVRDRGFPIRDAAGQVYRVAGIAEDITERKQAVEALRDSEQRFARFMQHLPGLAWVKDREGRYVYVNDAAERAFGRRRAELYGKTDDEVFPPETAAQFRANDRRALDGGTAARVIETLAHPDGSLHHSLVSKFPIPGPAGEAALVGGVAIDVTDRVQMEAELKEANRRKDEFLAMLGHELRNPLAPIRNAVEVMKLLGPAEPNLQRARDMIDRQVRHLARLVDDLLDISRITRGKIRL
ncbi:MAG TPA: PAS domain S-box protein, partial [Gemmataceae bacterium]|nr:PAS domain S-box protein [Gemmataceae bacterium]